MRTLDGPKTISFQVLLPASARATQRARAASKKANTHCEVALRHALTARGLRYRLHSAILRGVPDIIFARGRSTIFCDGDFWHGRNLDTRIAKLSRGHNADHWIAKMRRNVERGREQTDELRRTGWLVIRIWETDILRAPELEAKRVAAKLKIRRCEIDRKTQPRGSSKRTKSLVVRGK
jgi:DNA mismatch endonuclease (patch repair protein)